MGNARVGCIVPVNGNLTHTEVGHLILGPYNIPAANTTIYTNMLVAVDAAGNDLAVHTPKTRPAGFVVWEGDYKWGTTTPGHFVLVPSEIQVYICAWGCGILAIDQSGITDASYFGNVVYEGKVAGLVDVPATATAKSADTQEAGHTPIGIQLDHTAGNTGTGTGAADGDPIEVFFNCIPHCDVST